MKKLMSLWVGVILLTSVQMVWADDMGKMNGMSTPAAASTPVVKHKSVKKTAKKKSTAKAVQEVWACPMGDYSGPKTANGKCPKCGMDLEKVEKK